MTIALTVLKLHYLFTKFILRSGKTKGVNVVSCLMEFVFHRFSPHRAIPHMSIVFFHIKTRIYSSFNTLIIIVINIGALKSTNIVIKLAKYLMMEYCIPLILM